MDEREFLRHTLATVAYRGGKAIRNAPPGFAGFGASSGDRTPARILAHIGDLFDWASSMADGREVWHDSTPLAWDEECARFHSSLAAFDARLADAALAVDAGRLFQGPIADALTHVGQLAMLRRMAGAAIRGENYSRAGIEVGRVGPDQALPRREFD
ncbi:MAG: hypothetical protein NDJ94_04460 [Vicinamibacteria bacterium]|nr:hypothetical protein [Vicinamibacteria bacterium]